MDLSLRKISSPDLLLTVVLAVAAAILWMLPSASTTAILGVMAVLLSYAAISVILPAAKVPAATRIAGSVIFGALIAFLAGSSGAAASFRESGWAVAGSVVLIAAISLAAHLRRLSLPKRRRFIGGTISLPSIRLRRDLPTKRGGLTPASRRRGGSRTPAKVALFLFIVALASAFAFFSLHGFGEVSTSFYIDGEFSNLTAGRTASATVGIVNHEQKPVAYTLVIALDGSTILSREVDLLDSQAWKETLKYVINSSGKSRKLAFLLYKDGILSEPYKEHNLTVQVSEPPLIETPASTAGTIQGNAGGNVTATQSVKQAPASATGGGGSSTASATKVTSSTAGSAVSSKQTTRTSRSSGGGASSSSSGGSSTAASTTSTVSTTSTTSTAPAETGTAVTKTKDEPAVASNASAGQQSNVRAANESSTSENKAAALANPTFSTGPAEPNRPPAIVNLLFSPQSPQPQGAVINWTVAASDPEGDRISFRFLINNRIAADWSEHPFWIWNTTGLDPGDYTVTACIRDSLHAGMNSYDAKASKQFSIVQLNRPPKLADLAGEPAGPLERGTPITWTARASDPDGDPISYRFLLDERHIGNWSASNTWRWDTSQASVGEHNVSVWIRDGKHAADDSYDSAAARTCTIKAENRPPVLQGLTPEPKSPQNPGVKITWTADASDPDGDGISYRFMINGQAVSGWSEQPTWTWYTTGLPEGVYNVSVLARDGKHAAAYSYDVDAYSEFFVGTPNSPPDITEFAAGPGSPTAAGTIVTLTAGATDPDGDTISYRFLIGQHPLGDWSVSNRLIWNTSGLDAGRYNVSVQARDGNHATGDAADDETTISYILKQSNRKPELSGISADPPGLAEPGSRVRWTAVAVDPDGDAISYRFLVDATPATDWSDSPSWTWDTSGLDSRRYNISAQVRDGKHATGDAVDDEALASYTLSPPNQPPQISGFSAEAGGDSLPGVRVNWTATASDPEGDAISYRFLVDGALASDWSDSSTWIWSTEGLSPGAYDVTVQVRDAKHAAIDAFDDDESASFTLSSPNRPPQVSGLDADLQSPQEPGARISFTAHARDPDGNPVSYRFFVNGNPATGWSASPTWTWETSGLVAGQYNITVKARDHQYLESELTGLKSSRLFDLMLPNQIPILSGLSPDPAGPQSPGSRITWTASASDPDGDPVSYLFMVDGNRTGNWSESPSWTWNTTGLDAGDYNVTVRIRDGYHAGSEGYDGEVSVTSSLVKTNIAPQLISLLADPESPQDAGVVITWTASADDPDGDPMSYLFLLNGKAVTGWSASSSWSWDTTTLSEGNYRVEVRVRDSNHAGPDGFDGSKESVFTVTSVIDKQIDQLMAARSSQEQGQFASGDIQVAGGNSSTRAVLGRSSPSNTSGGRGTPVRVG